MSELTAYDKTNFQGGYFRFGPGDYLSNQLRALDPNMNDTISSIRVAPNTVVALYNNSSFITGSVGDSSRVIIGPQDIPALGAIGMDDKISAIRVRRIKLHDSYVSNPQQVTIYASPSFGGKSINLPTGQYDTSRLESQEIGFKDRNIQSIRVPSYVLVVLYAKDKFDWTQNANAIVGPAEIPDLSVYGFSGGINSMSIYGLENPEVERNVSSANLPAGTNILQAGLANRLDPSALNTVPGAVSLTNLSQDGIAVPTPVPGVYPGKLVQNTLTSNWIWVLLLLILIVLTAIAIVTSLQVGRGNTSIKYFQAQDI